jgi:hypothetical protein
LERSEFPNPNGETLMPTSSVWSKIWFRSALLIVIFFFLALFFVSPGVRYSQQDASLRTPVRIVVSPSDPKTDELIKIEHQKAIEEIKLRLEMQDSWYHYKFIIIGGIFALFLGQTGLSIGRSTATAKKSTKRFNDILTAGSNYSILVLAVVIALAIDMHIRNGMFGVQTIGLWIAYYVEPSYPVTVYFPWEQFLRQLNSPSIHLDSLYKLGFSLHLHFLTIAVYLVYVIVLQQICLTSNRRVRDGQKPIVIFGFLLVHLAALGFVFVAHAIPGAYAMNLIPFTRWASGWWNVGYYLIPWFFLVAVNLPYLLFLRNRKLDVGPDR